MFYSKKPITGIVKFVNYSDSSPRRAKRLSKYLQHISKTSTHYVGTNYLNCNDVEGSIKIFESKWKTRGTRSFKQGILAHGVPTDEYSAEEISKFNKELLQRNFPQFPWMFVVHTNKPLLHSHFLLATTNVLTGKKLTQSPIDLQTFKDCYDDLAPAYGLPVIKQRKMVQPLNSSLSMKSADYDRRAEIVDDSYFMEPAINVSEATFCMNEPMIQQYQLLSGVPPNSKVSNLPMTLESFLTPIALQIQQNVERWAEMGKHRRNELWLRSQ